MMEPRSNESFSPWQLLIHFVSGTVVFVVVALLAVGLSIVVHYFSSKGVNSFIIYGLQIAEYLLFVVDLLLFVVFVVRTAWRTLKKL